MNKIDGDGTFIPMYRELVERLGQDILKDGYRDGDFFCTLKTVCERYQVSITTARKAVSCMVQSQILSCRSSRGIYIRSTVPLKTAESLANTILIFEGHSDYSSYFSLRLGAVLKEISAVGYTTQITTANSWTSEMLEMVATSMTAVVLNKNSAMRFEQFIRSTHRCPVLLEHFMPEYESVPNLIMVRNDFEREIRLTLDYFRGKKQIVAVFFDDREYAPFRQTFQKAGLVLDEVEIESASATAGRAAVDRLEGYPKGTCFWVQDDFSALGILDEFLRRGRDLRSERAILASANPRLDYTAVMGLPVIGYDPVLLGRRAAQELCRLLKTGMGNRLVCNPAEANFDPDGRVRCELTI